MIEKEKILAGFAVIVSIGLLFFVASGNIEFKRKDKVENIQKTVTSYNSQKDQVCKSGERKCEGNRVLKCDSSEGYWQPLDICVENEECTDGICTVKADESSKANSSLPCNSDTKKCDNNIVYECNEKGDNWRFVKDCTENFNVCSDGECIKCYPGSPYTCVVDDVMKCSDDGKNFDLIQECAENEICFVDNCFNENIFDKNKWETYNEPKLNVSFKYPSELLDVKTEDVYTYRPPTVVVSPKGEKVGFQYFGMSIEKTKSYEDAIDFGYAWSEFIEEDYMLNGKYKCSKILVFHDGHYDALICPMDGEYYLITYGDDSDLDYRDIYDVIAERILETLVLGK